MVFVHKVAQRFIGDEQLHVGILHHEVETLRRIARVEGLVGATGLQHAQGDNRHPLATRNQHGDHILFVKALSVDIGGDAVGKLVQFFVGEAFFLKYHRDVVGRFRHLLAEFGDNRRTLVQLCIGLVETIQQGTLALGTDVDVAQQGLTQQALQNSLVTLHELGNQRLGVEVGAVFGLDFILFANIVGHQIEWHILVMLAELYGLHGFAHQLGIVKQEPLPCKYGVALQVKVAHDVCIGIDVVLAAADHLFLTGFQEVEHRSVVGELGVNGQRLHRHANGMLELRIGATVEHRGEQRFLLVVVLGQQEGIGRREECAFFDAVGLAESIHPIHVDAESAEHISVRVLGYFKVGEELGEGVAAVEVLGIPLFAFLESGRFAHLGFGKGEFLHRHLLGSQRATVVGRLHVANDNMV